MDPKTLPPLDLRPYDDVTVARAILALPLQRLRTILSIQGALGGQALRERMAEAILTSPDALGEAVAAAARAGLTAMLTGKGPSKG